jgi:hypothetical protein
LALTLEAKGRRDIDEAEPARQICPLLPLGEG